MWLWGPLVHVVRHKGRGGFGSRLLTVLVEVAHHQVGEENAVDDAGAGGVGQMRDGIRGDRKRTARITSVSSQLEVCASMRGDRTASRDPQCSQEVEGFTLAIDDLQQTCDGLDVPHGHVVVESLRVMDTPGGRGCTCKDTFNTSRSRGSACSGEKVPEAGRGLNECESVQEHHIHISGNVYVLGQVGAGAHEGVGEWAG